MITIQYNREGLEYDSYAMITSFFPNMETKQMLLTDSSEPLPADAIRISLDTDARAGSVFFAKGETLREDKQFYFGCEEDTLGNVDTDAVSEQQAEAVNDALQKRKHAWKIFFYDTLSEYTGKTLPWGALTGVRPTKLIMAVAKETAQGDILVEEEEREAVKKRMMNEYRVSERKADLGYRIAVLEDRILEPFRYDSARGEGYSVYVGIPFCPSRCLYCSFLSYPIEKWQKQVADYLECIGTELKACREIMKDKRLDTVYIGGGTPTALSAEELDVVLQAVEKYLPMEQTKEFTVEAGRPDSITVDKLCVMKKHAVNRISVNPQTFKQETLDLIGRHHTVEEVKEAFALARAEGFDNINMDLILGLPGETLADVERTYEKVKGCDPDSLTVHSLALKRASNMKAWVQEHGQISGLDYELAMNAGEAAAASMHMQPYYLYRQKNMAGALENTGFAREGKYGLYNILIMEEVQSIYAIGAGTVSKKVYTDGGGRIERCDTHKDLKLYLAGISEMIERKRKLFSGDE